MSLQVHLVNFNDDVIKHISQGPKNNYFLKFIVIQIYHTTVEPETVKDLTKLMDSDSRTQNAFLYTCQKQSITLFSTYFAFNTRASY